MRLLTIFIASLLTATIALAAVAYSVINVRPGDTLNMRSQPNPGARVVQTIPHDANGVLLTGRRSAGDWVEVTYQRRRGWVNARFLGLASGRYEIPAFLDCAGTEPFWSIRLTPGYASADLMFAERRYLFRISRFQQVMNRTDIAHIRGASRNASLSLIVRHESCSDGMSDTNYPYSAVALISGVNTIAGCCRPAQPR
ncbi:MAG: SH3 domain-containing protein [Alphaproteobacteria bacterium]|nr:SH3 domain-containing protein [Alphaproteobacteria bacterium]